MSRMFGAAVAAFIALITITAGLDLDESNPTWEDIELEGRELQSSSTCSKIQCGQGDKKFCEGKYTLLKSTHNDCCKDKYCKVCHGNGCDECCNGTFKAGYEYPCMACCEYDECATQCTDLVGSQKCKPGYKLIKVKVSQTKFRKYYPNGNYELQICDCEKNTKSSNGGSSVRIVDNNVKRNNKTNKTKGTPGKSTRGGGDSTRSPPRIPPKPQCAYKKPTKPCRIDDTNFCSNHKYKFEAGNIYDCCKDKHCKICHPNGCDECCEGYFKPNYDHPCISFCDYDPHATLCSDFNGSQKCEHPYKLKAYRYKGKYDMQKCMW